MWCVERAPSPAAFDFEAGQHKPPPLCCLGGDGSGRARLPIVPPQSPLFKGSGAPSFALFAKGEFHGCSPFGISRRRHSGPLPLSLNGAAQAGPLFLWAERQTSPSLWVRDRRDNFDTRVHIGDQRNWSRAKLRGP